MKKIALVVLATMLIASAASARYFAADTGSVADMDSFHAPRFLDFPFESVHSLGIWSATYD